MIRKFGITYDVASDHQVINDTVCVTQQDAIQQCDAIFSIACKLGK